jgi:hypothetical protein
VVQGLVTGTDCCGCSSPRTQGKTDLPTALAPGRAKSSREGPTQYRSGPRRPGDLLKGYRSLVVLTHAVSLSRLVMGKVATNLRGAQKPLRLASRSKTRDWEDKAEMRGVEFG